MKPNTTENVKVSATSAIKALARLHGGNQTAGLEAFVRSWRDEPTVDSVAKRCSISKEEARAIAQALRSGGVDLPKKYQGKQALVSKTMASHLQAILGGKMVNDPSEDLDDDDEVSQAIADTK